MTIHEKLKKLRNDKGLTQDELADFLGFTRSTIATWESNVIPPYQKLTKLADFFGVSVDYFNENSKTESSMNNFLVATEKHIELYRDIAKLNDTNFEMVKKIVSSLLANQ